MKSLNEPWVDANAVMLMNLSHAVNPKSMCSILLLARGMYGDLVMARYIAKDWLNGCM